MEKFDLVNYFDGKTVASIEMEIDPIGAQLEKVICERAAIFSHWRVRRALAARQTERAKLRLAFVKARISAEIRGNVLIVNGDEMEIRETGHGKKMTEGALSDMLYAHKDYMEAANDVIAAKMIEDVGDGIVDALREKGKAITDIVHVQLFERRSQAALSTNSP